MMNKYKCNIDKYKTEKFVIDKNFIMFGSVVIYVLLMVGAYFNSIYLKCFAICICMFFTIFADISNAFRLLAFFTPCSRIFNLSNGGRSLIIICYLIVFLRCMMIYGIADDFSDYILAMIPIFICFTKILDSNFYDLPLLVGIVVAVFAWKYFFLTSKYYEKIELVHFFAVGIICFFIGMLFSYAFIEKTDRLTGLLDDTNYTGSVFAASFSFFLFLCFHKIPLTNKYLYLTISLVGGVLTSSRGFLLSLAILLLIYIVYGIIKQRSVKLLCIVIAVLLLLLFLYLLNVPIIVSLYNRTIGRTLKLKENYNDGDFMDVTSGRFVLWGYYLKRAFADIKILFFGRGFKDYYLMEEGGYILTAHNFIVAGIIGFGIIGLVCVLILYFRIDKIGKFNFLDITLLSGFLVPYLFLDGILDFRFVLYFVLFFTCKRIKDEFDKGIKFI